MGVYYQVTFEKRSLPPLTERRYSSEKQGAGSDATAWTILLPGQAPPCHFLHMALAGFTDRTYTVRRKLAHRALGHVAVGAAPLFFWNLLKGFIQGKNRLDAGRVGREDKGGGQT